MTAAKPDSVHVLMSRVMHDIGAVKKGDYNAHQKFNFRGIDALQNACYGPMCKHGVFVLPEVVEAHYEAVKTSTGKDAQQATLRVRFTFYGPAGDSVSAVTAGEAMDSADKATSKAMAAAFKYALLQSFCIPTEGQDDADASSPERGERQVDGSRPPRKPVNPSKDPQPRPADDSPPFDAKGSITDTQIADISALLVGEDAPDMLTKILDWAKVDKLEDLSSSQADVTVRRLAEKDAERRLAEAAGEAA